MRLIRLSTDSAESELIRFMMLGESMEGYE